MITLLWPNYHPPIRNAIHFRTYFTFATTPYIACSLFDMWQMETSLYWVDQGLSARTSATRISSRTGTMFSPGGSRICGHDHARCRRWYARAFPKHYAGRCGSYSLVVMTTLTCSSRIGYSSRRFVAFRVELLMSHSVCCYDWWIQFVAG